MSDSPSSLPPVPSAAEKAAEGAPAPGSLAELTLLVRRARDAEAAVAEAEGRLRDAEIALARIVEGLLPEAMAAIGMDEFRTADGLMVRVGTTLTVKQPPVAQRAAAYRWLEENDQGGLIKRSVEIAFGAGQTEAERAQALADRLGVDFPGAVREQQEVNSSSLKAYLSRALAAGESPPLELFGARVVRAAKFEQK